MITKGWLPVASINLRATSHFQALTHAAGSRIHDDADAEQIAWEAAPFALNLLRGAVHERPAHDIATVNFFQVTLTEIAQFQPKLAAIPLLRNVLGRYGVTQENVFGFDVMM